MTLNAGLLTERVTLQQRDATADALGQPPATWSAVDTVWASVRHPRGSEALQAGKDLSVNQVSVRLRWRTDVTPAMRLLHGAVVYEIKAVLPDHLHRAHVDLLCELING